MSHPSTPVLLIDYPQTHIAVVTLNRPEARNAVNGELARALEQAVYDLDANDAVRVVVLTGEGAVFCAGADLKAVAQGQGDTLWRPQAGFAGFVDVQRHKPWVAALNGSALAGGCELMLACDMVVAASHAQLGLPEVMRGLIAAAGGLMRLPRAIPRNLAIEMALTTQTISAERAHTLGLVNRLVNEGPVLPAALELAELVASNAPVAVRESLALIKMALDQPESVLREHTMAARDRIAHTEDFREGPRAFIEKRPPQWLGR